MYVPIKWSIFFILKISLKWHTFILAEPYKINLFTKILTPLILTYINTNMLMYVNEIYQKVSLIERTRKQSAEFVDVNKHFVLSFFRTDFS